jgi:hypothetical protein
MTEETTPKAPPFPWIVPIPNAWHVVDEEPKPFFVEGFTLRLMLHEDGTVTWDV